MAARNQLLDLKLRIWRQRDADTKGSFETHHVKGITPDMSFLEMLDTLNNQLLGSCEEPIAFDSDCREGICGTCGLVINGQAHGPLRGTATCQLYMRHFSDGDEIVIEPFRADAFPVVKDLVVDRSALDRIVARGGYVSINTGNAPDANAILVSSDEQEQAMDAAACIGCGACVASCKNASAMLFTAAKVSHLSSLPQGQPERRRRALAMVRQHDDEGFGGCTNTYECAAVCPAEISVREIAKLNREYVKASLRSS